MQQIVFSKKEPEILQFSEISQYDLHKYYVSVLMDRICILFNDGNERYVWNSLMILNGRSIATVINSNEASSESFYQAIEMMLKMGGKVFILQDWDEVKNLIDKSIKHVQQD